jgi:hypothetical protein
MKLSSRLRHLNESLQLQMLLQLHSLRLLLELKRLDFHHLRPSLRPPLQIPLPATLANVICPSDRRPDLINTRETDTALVVRGLT